MSQNPINLVFRFILELLGLLALGYWGWSATPGPARWILAVAAPVIAAVIWASFRPRQDPGPKEKPPVLVPGPVRLLIEVLFFGTAAWGLFASGLRTLALLYAGAVILHTILSYDRVLDLLRSPER